MKFIHMADSHLDMAFTSLKYNKGLISKRRIEHKKIFKDVIELCKEENVEYLFISGDLFEQKYVEKDTVSYIISNFKSIPNVKVFISPGNHDPIIKTSPYNIYDWPENVHIFGSDISKYSYGNIDIYGYGFDNYEMNSDKLFDFKVDSQDKINILVTHGTLDGAVHQYNDIRNKDLQQFDYVALGHIHDKKIDNSKIIYPGSLISCGFDELGEHGVVIGEIEKNKLEIKFRNMDYRQTEILEIDISEYNLIQEILDKLDLKDNIYRIILTGIRNVKVQDLIESIKASSNYVCDVIDETHMEYNLEEISKQKTLKGIFTKKILDKLEEGASSEEVNMAIEYMYKSM